MFSNSHLVCVDLLNLTINSYITNAFLTDVYNVNTVSEQVGILNTLSKMMKTFQINQN